MKPYEDDDRLNYPMILQEGTAHLKLPRNLHRQDVLRLIALLRSLPIVEAVQQTNEHEQGKGGR